MNIEEEIHKLKGEYLIDSNRTMNMECLQFGEEKNNPKYGLHIHSNWRIIHENKIIIGSNDLYEPPINVEYSEEFNYENENLRDEKMIKILKNKNLRIKEVELNELKDLTIKFENNFELQVLSFLTIESEYNEYWRVLDRINDIHYVARLNELSKE